MLTWDDYNQDETAAAAPEPAVVAAAAAAAAQSVSGERYSARSGGKRKRALRSRPPAPCMQPKLLSPT